MTINDNNNKYKQRNKAKRILHIHEHLLTPNCLIKINVCIVSHCVIICYIIVLLLLLLLPWNAFSV